MGLIRVGNTRAVFSVSVGVFVVLLLLIEKIPDICVLGMSENWNQVAHSVKNPVLLGKFASFR